MPGQGVGNPASVAAINQELAGLAVGLRNWVNQALALSQQVNGQGAGLAALQGIGFAVAANPNDPGGNSDAQTALNDIAYFNTVAQIINGTATQATLFNFLNATAHLAVGL